MINQVLISQDSLPLFGDTTLTALLKTGSDHNPMAWETADQRRIFNASFHFEKMWLMHASQESNVSEWWKQNFTGDKLTQVAKKLRFDKKNLNRGNKELFVHLMKKKTDLKNKLLNLEAALQSEIYTEDVIGTIPLQRGVLVSKLQSFKVKEGDRNTKL